MPPKKILLAEDDTDDRELFHDFMQSRSDVTLLPVAENGEEVFRFLASAEGASQFPDLIILDQNMPKRNGLQTLQMLKENKSYENIPVFIYSTYADENLRRQSMDLGAALVFPKPYSPEGYYKMVDAALHLLGTKAAGGRSQDQFYNP